ncbi:N-acetylgalactosaminyltransferase 7 [Holothuria leucospilota]|uniref:N-acetylgalactosaminyltransferase 7 n=1 Tax=Holothuria leucospilota TaxID=206669 RepID=A0A9Q1H5R9_HOLLE|nr:N-acetylgalactosaminyltransferase 7 [Holothuria leucospilota]
MSITISGRRHYCTIRRIVLASFAFFAASPLLVIFLLQEPGESFGLEKSLRNFRSNSTLDHKIPEGNIKVQPDLKDVQYSSKNNRVNRLHQPVNKAQQVVGHKNIELPVLKEGIIGNYEPRMPRKGPDGPGEGGKKVGRIPEEEEQYAQSYKEHGFNMVNSEKISLDRTVPDLRDSECKFWHYPSKLPLSSVVIVFCNEGWSTLMRTVHSVINETPPELLLEIVMVDDFSDKEHLQTKLEDYIKIPFFQNKVKLVRNVKREGLIRSRIIGAQHARAEVLIFLDAHCECSPNWLPPLVAEIAVNR